MKILWLSDFRHKDSSEITYQSIELCNRLEEKGLEPILCNLVPLDIRHQPFVKTTLKNMKLIYPVGGLFSTIQKIDPDVVLVYGVLETTVYLEIPDIAREYPTVYYSLFDPLELLIEETYTSGIPRIVDFIQKVDHVIVSSKNMKNIMQSYGCMDLTVIPPGINTSKYTPTSCRDPTITILAKTSAIRNHLTLIEAISLVREEVPEVELAIVPWREPLPGKPKLVKMYYDLLQQMGLSAQVKFLGALTPRTLFKEVSIFANPSFSSSSPSAILSAYLHGVPCVLSDAGWSSMFEAPLKAKHDDPQDWANKLINLITDEDLYMAVRTNQHNELIRKFDIDKTVDKFIEVFEELQLLQPYKVKRSVINEKERMGVAEL